MSSLLLGEMEDFDLAICDADLVEPSVQGNWFTWTSKVHGSGVLCRLDCILVNDDWLSAWLNFLGGLRSVVRRYRYLLAVRKLGGYYFRSISCCNVIYKCISKILADRLRVWLPSFISGNQSAFISGRSIIDNILLCQELVGGYHLYSGKPQCTLKVDLQKAYDSVNWDFLFGLLIAIGTPLKFVSWIRACITSPMFSIMINGSLERFFHGRKGVRQGDPLSPFLFIMVMEVLSPMLNKPP
ncbi:hypothetical protein IC582_013575 [Cucumis melo]